MKKMLLVIFGIVLIISCKNKKDNFFDKEQEKSISKENKIEKDDDYFIKTASYINKDNGENIVKILVPDDADDKTIENAMIKTLKEINREKKFSNYTIRVFGDEKFWSFWKDSDTHGYMKIKNYEVKKTVIKSKKEIPTQEEKEIFFQYDNLVNELSNTGDPMKKTLKDAAFLLSKNKNISEEELHDIVEKVFQKYVDLKK